MFRTIAFIVQISAVAYFFIVGVEANAYDATCPNCGCLEASLLAISEKREDKVRSDFTSGACASFQLPAPFPQWYRNNVALHLKRIAPEMSAACLQEMDLLIQSLSSPPPACGDPDQTDDRLASELIRRCNVDQHTLDVGLSEEKYPDGSSNACGARRPIWIAAHSLVRIDNSSRLWLEDKRILSLYRLKNDVVNKAIWVITQHTDIYPELQELILALNWQAYREGLLEAYKVASLADRIALKKDPAHQLFGTHTKCDGSRAVLSTPVDDVAEAEARRAELGLPSLGKFLEKRSNERC